MSVLRKTNSRADDIITEGDNGTAGKHWAAGSLVTAPSVRKTSVNALSPNQRTIEDRAKAYRRDAA